MKIKKLLCAALATSMVLGMTVPAFAETEKATTSKATTFQIEKSYTVTGATTVGEEGKDGYVDGTKIYPAETLSFTSTAAATNPDKGTTNVTINDLVVAGNSEQKITINIPEYDKVGTYHYTIKEVAGSTTGVGYTTDEEISVSVLVTYDYDDTDNDGHLKTATVGITKKNDVKDDEFNNTYDLGSLEVKKTVTGNLGDKNKEFDIYVTMTSSNAIASDITYVEAEEIKTITAEDVNNGGAEVKLTLKHGETAYFYNIPAGVTYNVVEDSKYSDDTDKNGENGYEKPEYAFEDANKAIAQNDEDSVEVTNKKSTEVDTGISLDNMPYIMMLAMAVLGAFGFVSKKRKEEEMF